MFRRILLALDAGEAGAVATSFTIALAGNPGTSVHVVHVDEHLRRRRGTSAESPAGAADVVGRALKDLHASGVHATGTTYRTAGFDVPAAICDLAARVRADVIVLGSRRRRHLPSVLRRSTRDRVARRTPLPVVTAPAPLRVGRHDPVRPELPPADVSVRS